MRIYGKTAHKDYEGIGVEFLSRCGNGDGMAELTASTGEKAVVVAAFAGPGGAHTVAPEEIFVRRVISGRESFPYLWAL